MAEEGYYKTFNFRPHKSGDSVLEKTFTFTEHSDSPLASVILQTRYKDCKLTSVDGGITIVSAEDWIFKIDEQIINWPVRDYFYEIVTISSAGVVRTYINGIWKIVE